MYGVLILSMIVGFLKAFKPICGVCALLEAHPFRALTHGLIILLLHIVIRPYLPLVERIDLPFFYKVLLNTLIHIATLLQDLSNVFILIIEVMLKASHFMLVILFLVDYCRMVIIRARDLSIPGCFACVLRVLGLE